MVYNYDRDGRLIGMDVERVTGLGGTFSPLTATGSSNFYYDEGNNRVKLIARNGQGYSFVYDPTASIPAVVYETSPTNRYINIREPDGGLVARQRLHPGTGETLASFTYHFDGLGSTRAISDGSGVVTDTYDFDAWGKVTRTSGTSGSLVTTIAITAAAIFNLSTALKQDFRISNGQADDK